MRQKKKKNETKKKKKKKFPNLFKYNISLLFSHIKTTHHQKI